MPDGGACSESSRSIDLRSTVAIRRLSKTYFMVEKKDLLHETSGLMAEHVMQGKSAPDVIKALEVLFQHHYRLLKQDDPESGMAKHP